MATIIAGFATFYEIRSFTSTKKELNAMVEAKDHSSTFLEVIDFTNARYKLYSHATYEIVVDEKDIRWRYLQLKFHLANGTIQKNIEPYFNMIPLRTR